MRGHHKDDEQAIDQLVGQNVRTRRILLGKSQSDVARELGITFQQLQKYEHGTNRISASRMVSIARTLHCSPSAFFEGVDEISTPPGVRRQTSVTLTAAIDALPPRQRRAVEQLVRTMTNLAGATPEESTETEPKPVPRKRAQT